MKQLSLAADLWANSAAIAFRCFTVLFNCLPVRFLCPTSGCRTVYRTCLRWPWTPTPPSSSAGRSTTPSLPSGKEESYLFPFNKIFNVSNLFSMFDLCQLCHCPVVVLLCHCLSIFFAFFGLSMFDCCQLNNLNFIICIICLFNVQQCRLSFLLFFVFSMFNFCQSPCACVQKVLPEFKISFPPYP